MDAWMDAWIDKRWVGGRMCGWMGGSRDGQNDVWMNGWIDG